MEGYGFGSWRDYAKVSGLVERVKLDWIDMSM
jgi:hypothetical protein